jgi:Rieske Fe-S protein
MDGSVDVGGACRISVAGGNVSAITMNSLRVLSGSLVLGRDASGLYAMSAICTHAGCPVNVVTSGGQPSLSCPCHGSTFNANGAVTRGPAATPLQHYQVDVASDGAIAICSGVSVPATARTAAS